MRIDQIRYLVEIADAGSLTAVAEKYHISQPRISQLVTALEEELDIQIFIRSKLGTYPTETGKLIIQKAREVLFYVEELNSVSQTSAHHLSGSLTIGTVPSMCSTILPRTLSIFKDKFPKIEIKLIEGGYNLIRQCLLKNEIDIGLATYRTPSDLHDKLSFKPLLKGQVMACVNRSSPLALKKTISCQEIVNYPIVIMDEGFRLHDRILNSIKRYGEPNILFTARNPASVKKVILEGLAIGFDPDISLKTDPYVLNGDIIPLTIIEETPTSFGVWYAKKDLSDVSDRFVNELKIQAENFIRLYKL